MANASDNSIVAYDIMANWPDRRLSVSHFHQSCMGEALEFIVGIMVVVCNSVVVMGTSTSDAQTELAPSVDGCEYTCRMSQAA
jgi:hypothetical protein